MEHSKLKFDAIPLNSIISIDPDLEATLTEQGLNLPLLIDAEQWELTVLKAFLTSHPILVRKMQRAGYQCIGGVRQWKLAQASLDMEKDDVPVLIYPARMNPSQKQALFVAEIFLLQAMFGFRRGDGELLGAVWGQLKNTGWKLDDFGKAMDIDPRAYNKKFRDLT